MYVTCMYWYLVVDVICIHTPRPQVPGAACPGGDSCNFAHGEEELRKPGEAIERGEQPLFLSVWINGLVMG